MKRIVDAITNARVIAIIREQSDDDALFCAEAAYAGGLRCLEITFGGGADTIAVVRRARERLPDAHIGVGTTRTLAQVRRAVRAGASFIVSPHTDARIVKAATKAKVVAIPGALTPTEIVAAENLGAPLIKVFPIAPLGGAAYLRQVLSPLRGARLVATGGVRLEHAHELIRAGAVAIGAATDLFQPKWVAARDKAAIAAQAERYLAAVNA